jgi:hypothetical protein
MVELDSFGTVIIGVLIGAVLAIFSGIGVQWLNGKYSILKLKTAIEAEIISICVGIKQMEQNEICTYRTSIWEAAKNSALIIDLIDDWDYFKKVNDTYATISELENLECSADLSDCDRMNKLIEKRAEVVSYIEKNWNIDKKHAW